MISASSPVSGRTRALRFLQMSAGIQWPSSARRERLHPPLGLLPKPCSWNRIRVKGALGIFAGPLDIFKQSLAGYPLRRARTERDRTSLPLSSGNVNPKPAIRWYTRIFGLEDWDYYGCQSFCGDKLQDPVRDGGFERTVHFSANNLRDRQFPPSPLLPCNPLTREDTTV